MPRTAFAIRHVPFEDLGSLAPALAARGLEPRYLEAGLDDLAALELSDDDVLVILGGPIGANDEGDYPFLVDELRLVERCLRRERAVLGICLGAQIMARALGARVRPGPRPEIGWAPIALTGEGRASALAPLAAAPAVFHWHGDTFELPAGARHLASTELCPNQAFSYGPRALALQFHAEVGARELERWYIGHVHELQHSRAATVPALRRDAATYSPRLTPCAIQCWDRWLDAAGRAAP